ncbi:pimeloyl-ACP methyl ester carboxylesterase [Chitinophaga niastensis]|uniref:Pimeloyl-ACP methyl ester carboxylesterase n=1 Tax=Chitinophaga niastensis TaxID=536980 RepID=A0A2P8HS26_CHINA|nr:alpha/beta hydrolase [Chitinophaga niastensis]PSL49031.1 pimeloyl-ACP methyl ester carboxylesterase [Chitinophaga niastensis]
MQTNQLPILFLHGALGATTQFQPLADHLAPHYDVHLLNFSGHGDTPFSEQGFSIQVFAAEVLSYMESKQLEYVHIFGYSMGGYVAMYLARHYPEKIGRVITLATKYNWNEATAGKEVKQLNPVLIEEKVPSFAQVLQERHAANDWKTVVLRTAQLIEELGHQSLLKQADYAQIASPCMLMIGDRDNMVSFQETIEVYKTLPLAQLTIMPDTAHPLEKADVPLLAYYIRRFTTQNI